MNTEIFSKYEALIAHVPKVSESQKSFLIGFMNEVQLYADKMGVSFHFCGSVHQPYFGGYVPDNTLKCGLSLFGINRVSGKTCLIIPDNIGISSEHYFKTQTWTSKKKVAIPLDDERIKKYGQFIIQVAKDYIPHHCKRSIIG